MKQRLLGAFFRVTRSPKPSASAGGSARAPARGPAPAPETVSSPWHAVSVACGPKACPAARQLSGMRWLSKQAPRLPLGECTAAKCDCRYRHHADRRSKLRRQFDRESFNRHFDGQDRRERPRGRRASDM